MISGFPAWFIFRYLKYPWNRALMNVGIAISEPPARPLFHLRILKF